MTVDEEGFLYFVGRNDEMIKTSGYRVSPTEIEEVVYGTGRVRDAVALGVDDPRSDSASSWWSARRTAHSTRTELLAALRRQLPLYMVPQRRHRQAELPRTPNNKFDRNLLRQGARRIVSVTRAMQRPGSRESFSSAASRSSGSPTASAQRRSSRTTGMRLTERVELLRSRLPADVHLSYAVKANPMPAVVQHLSPLVDGFDVASAAEMRAALDTPTPADRVSFAGPGKTPAELTQAVAAGVTIELESETEARRITAIGEQLGIRPRVAVRVNPDFQIKGSGMRLGGGAQQFGVDSERVPALLAELAAADLELLGSTSSRGRRTSTLRSCARRSARPSHSRCSSPTPPPNRFATSTSAADSASPTSSATSHSTSRPSHATLRSS